MAKQTGGGTNGGRVRAGRGGQSTAGGTMTLAVASLVLVATLGVCIVWPIGLSVLRSAGDAADAGGDGVSSALAITPIVVARSLGAAVLIGVLASALGWPGARLLTRHKGALWAPLILTPMLVPSYLAYAGWGLTRDPGTLVGDTLTRAAADGARWAPILAGKTLAVLGLAMWASPLASLVLASGIARRDPAAEDALRLEPATRAQRWRATLGLHRGAITGSAALVALVMLGSAVPMHLAQLDTLALVVWRELAGSARDEWWRSWVAATPLLIVALAAGWGIGGMLVRRAMTDNAEGPRDESAGRARAGAVVGELLVWTLAVGAPLALFAWALQDLGALARFWRLSGSGATTSLAVGTLTGAVCLAIGLALSAAISIGGRRARVIAGVGVRVMLVGALIPGVLVGAAIAEATGGAGRGLGLDRGLAGPVMAGVARGSFVVGVVACWASWSEPAALRDARRQLGVGWRAWALGALPMQAPALVGGAIAGAAMSVHEIEASVMVWPPGRDSLARQTLEYLHYARMDELSAAAIWISGAGLALALLAGALISLASVRLRAPTRGGRA